MFARFFFCFSLSLLSVQARANCAEGTAEPGEYVVQYKSTGLEEKISSFARSSRVLNSKPKSQFESKSQAQGLSVILLSLDENGYRQVKSDPAVVSVEKNCVRRLFANPNDPDAKRTYAQELLRLPGAWDLITHSSAIVAIPDSGVEITHPDLKNNIWGNQAEISGSPGVDDDQNGYIDDFYGWAFHDKNNDVTPGSYQGAGHGTHVAGIVGAVGNNAIGVAGTFWSGRMMVLRPFRKTDGLSTVADLVESIYYAVNNGAKIINCSWGGEDPATQAEKDAFLYAEEHGVFVVAAAGDRPIDVSNFTPASLPTVVAVGSSNSLKQISTFSPFGKKMGLFSAGGDEPSGFGVGLDEAIYSTLPSSNYGLLKGTSMAAPFVSGVAALVKTVLPNLKPSELRKIIQTSDSFVTTNSDNQTLIQVPLLNAQMALQIAFQIKNSNPSCTENCLQSAPAGDESVLKFPVAKFGGGGCSMNTKTAGGWDILLLVCFFASALRIVTNHQKTKK